MNNENEVVASFLDAMHAAGIELADPHIVADGRRHRVKDKDDKGPKRSAAYILHMDDRPAGMFWHYRLLGGNNGVGWTFKGETRELTRDERRAWARDMAAKRAARETADRAGYEAAAERARAIWAAAVPATEHPYLKRKKIKSHLARIGAHWRTGEAVLLYPAIIGGAISSLQAIFAEKQADGRDKDFLPGGRMAGAYCPFGPPPKDGDTLLLAEGCATTATCHEATGLTAFAAFSAGNLQTVAAMMRERWPNSPIIVCGDNDQFKDSNPGVFFATEAAQAVGGRVTWPAFPSDDADRRTDFNDLALHAGLETVRDAILPPPPTEIPQAVRDAVAAGDYAAAYGAAIDAEMDKTPAADTDLPEIGFDDENLPFQILGVDRGTFYYLPHGSQQVVGLAAGGHTKLNLIALASGSWWGRRFPAKAGFNADDAADMLMRACERRGIYDASRIRGRGAWWDDGRPVLHLGDRLIVDADVVPVAKMRSRYIYEAAAPMAVDLSSPLPTSDAHRLAAICESLAWERPIHGKLLAGWIVAALVCGALRWRPHVWITGGAGTGKSWVMDNIIRRCLGDSGLAVQGSTTEAYLRQMLCHDALPVTFDEAEQEKDQRAQQRIQSVLELARGASSETGAVIGKGSANGNATNYRVRSCFAFSSIGIGIEKYADASRITVLSLDAKRALSAEQFADLKAAVLDTLTDQYVQRLHARAIRLIGVIRRNAEIFAAAGAAHLGAQRIGDQLGALLAGAYALYSDREITPEKARAWIEAQEWTDEKAQHAQRDELACIAHIAEAVVRIENRDRSVSELVSLAARITQDTDQDISQSGADATLRRLGLRVDGERVFVSNTHSGVARLLNNTPWSKNWNRVLERLDGAAKSEPMRFGSGTPSRGVAVPRAYFLPDEPAQRGF